MSNTENGEGCLFSSGSCPSAANIPALLEKLSSGNARDAINASRALDALATASDREALRLAQGGALPALVRAFRGPNDTVVAHAGAALGAVARVVPDLVADAAGSALVAVLRGGDILTASASAGVFGIIAERNPARVAAEPGALQALSSAFGSAISVTVHNAALALYHCAKGSPGLARLVADTPGLLAAMVGVIASSSSSDAARCAVFTLFEIAEAGADLAARVVSTPGAVPALLRVLLQCSDGIVNYRAAAVFAQVADAGPEVADAVATADVLAALVSAARQAGAPAPGLSGMGVACMAAFANIARASLPLALRVADTPGAEAAMLAALTGGEVPASINATAALEAISRADGKRVARLLSAPAVPQVLAGLLQSNEPAGVRACTKLLAHLEHSSSHMVARLPPLPGRALQALCAFMKDADGDEGAAVCAADVLCGLVEIGHEQARRVITTPGFVQAITSALCNRNTSFVTTALAVVGIASAADPSLAARVASGAEVFPMLLRAVQSSETNLALNAAGVLASVCAFDPGLACRAAEAPGVLRALVAMLQWGPGDVRTRRGVHALDSMAVGGLCHELAACLAAEEGLIPALAALAQSSSGVDAALAARALAAITCAGGRNLANPIGGTEGTIPALVGALSMEVGGVKLNPVVTTALRTIAAASPESLGRRVLDAGAAAAAVAVAAASLDGLAPQQAAAVVDPSSAAALESAAGLLRMLATLDAAAVTAALAPLLRGRSSTPACAFARSLLGAAPLSLGPAAINALARQAEAAAQVRARGAALEALTVAAAVEADAARPQLCAECGVQQHAAGAVRLRPCGGCSKKGPAGRVLYCGADCQRAHWPAHKAYCKQAAAAAAAAVGAAHGGAA